MHIAQKERGYIVKNTANLQLTKWVKMEYTLCGVKKFDLQNKKGRKWKKKNI